MNTAAISFTLAKQEKTKELEVLQKQIFLSWENMKQFKICTGPCSTSIQYIVHVVSLYVWAPGGRANPEKKILCSAPAVTTVEQAISTEDGLSDVVQPRLDDAELLWQIFEGFGVCFLSEANCHWLSDSECCLLKS